jgi:predicted nucleic acid-binding protein
MDHCPDIGLTDLSIAAVAEHLEITTVATTDRRHFAQIVAKHVPGFRLVPA